MAKTLYTNGRIWQSAGDGKADWMLTAGSRITALGCGDTPVTEDGTAVVDLGGKLVRRIHSEPPAVARGPRRCLPCSAATVSAHPSETPRSRIRSAPHVQPLNITRALSFSCAARKYIQVLPGLHDSHIHVYALGEATFFVDLGGSIRPGHSRGHAGDPATAKSSCATAHLRSTHRQCQ